jgi:hypothetical protein
VEQIAASGFHCHIDDLVVVAPFLPGIQSTEPIALLSAPLRYAETFNSFVFIYLSYTDGRGPPSDFCS